MRTYQICALICAVGALSMGDMEDAKQALKASVHKCSTGYGLSKETTRYIVTHNYTIQDENDENQRCFVQCVGQEMGDVLVTELESVAIKSSQLQINSEGVFDVDHATEAAEQWLQWAGHNKSNIKEAMEKCSKITGTGTCMTNYLIIKCAMKAGE